MGIRNVHMLEPGSEGCGRALLEKCVCFGALDLFLKQVRVWKLSWTPYR